MNERTTIERSEAMIPVLARRLGSWRVSVERCAFTPSELGRRYDGAAAGWDRRLARLGIPGAYAALFRRMVDEQRIEMQSSRRSVLDCGVGTGAASAALLAALGGVPRVGLSLSAVDVSPRMLAHAGAKLRRAGLDVTVRLCDVCALPFDEGVFDLVIAAHTLEHVARPDAALREIVRVLKPGGTALACMTRRSVLGTIVHLKHRTHRVTEAEATRWLRGSGLADVRCLPFGEGILPRRLSVACIGRRE